MSATTTTTRDHPGAPSELLHDLRLVGRQVKFEQLSFWLNPIGAIFTIVFSVLFLVLLASTAGNSTVSFYGGITLSQYYVPGFIAYGVMAACFNVLAIAIVNRRETGLLKRIRLSPLPTWILMAAIFVSTMVIAAIQVIILLVVGKLAYGVAGPANPTALVLAILVGMLAFTAMGMGVSTLVPNADAAGPMVSIVFFLLVALSGLWFPIAPSSGLAKVVDFFPVRHLITGLNAAFNAKAGASTWSWNDLGVMLAWGVIGAVVARRRWRWSPRRA
jgi:ABC-2 type transport system permease protein